MQPNSPAANPATDRSAAPLGTSRRHRALWQAIAVGWIVCAASAGALWRAIGT